MAISSQSIPPVKVVALPMAEEGWVWVSERTPSALFTLDRDQL